MSPATNGDPLVPIYIALVLGMTILLAGAAWALRVIFENKLDDVRSRDHRTYVSVCWGWMFSRIVLRVQLINLGLLLFTVGDPPIFTKFLMSNLPPNWSVLITLAGWLSLIALFEMTFQNLYPKAGAAGTPAR